jgi:hypothetical protein
MFSVDRLSEIILTHRSCLDYAPDDRSSIPGQGMEPVFQHTVQIGSGAQLAHPPYQMVIGGFL